MLKSHEPLLKFRHDSRFEFAKVRVCYIDRGAPRDCTCAEGNTIPVLDAYYFEVKSQAGLKYIPYHRIRQTRYAGVTVWERPEPAPAEPARR
jgi:uncharacterized protein (UPF0248 family)